MGFSRQKYWSGQLLPSPGDLPDPGSNYSNRIEPVLRDPGALPVAPIPGHAADSLHLWLRVLKALQVTLGFLGGTTLVE